MLAQERQRARRSWSSRARPRWRAAQRRGCRPRAPAPGPARPRTFETTTAISPPSVPARWASMRACRLQPRPLMSTPILRRARVTARALIRGRRPALHHGADDEARLAAALERVLDVVEVLGRDDHHHADAHVEGAVHLVLGDGAALLDEPEERAAPPRRPCARARPGRRAGRAGCCRGSRRP